MADNETTRRATTSRIGPWFVLNPRNPAAPGMRFSILKELVRGGQVSAHSIVRGPTTKQLWAYAGRVKGLSKEFGLCWSCGRKMPPTKAGEEADDFCIYCGALQEPPVNPDQMLDAVEPIGVSAQHPSQAAATDAMADATGPRMPVPSLRRAHVPRPKPQTRPDGSDALLGVTELSTAFQLDRSTPLPWKPIVGWILALLLVAMLVLGIAYAMVPAVAEWVDSFFVA